MANKNFRNVENSATTFNECNNVKNIKENFRSVENSATTFHKVKYKEENFYSYRCGEQCNHLIPYDMKDKGR